MQHVGPALLTPVLPVVELHPVLVQVAIPIVGGPGGCAHTIGVETGIKGAGVIQIQFMDSSIKPVNLFQLVLEVLWLRAIVGKPTELWGVHEASDR